MFRCRLLMTSCVSIWQRVLGDRAASTQGLVSLETRTKFRPSCSWARQLLPCIALLGMSIASTECFAQTAPQEVELIDHLDSVWREWESRIQSLEIDGHKFVGAFRDPENVFSQKQLADLVEQQIVPLVEASEGALDISVLATLTDPIFRTDYDPQTPKRPLGTWRPFSLIIDGSSVRADEQFAGQRLTTIRADGQEQQYHAAIRQADIHPSPTGYSLENRDVFVHPMSTFEKEVAKKNAWKFSPLEAGRYRIDSGKVSAVVDGKTGFVSRESWRDKSGRLRVEYFQLLPMLTTTSVPVAKVIVRAHYFTEAESVRNVTVYVLNNVHCNREIPNSRFSLSIPAKTVVVDHSVIDPNRSRRDGRPAHLAVRTKEAVDDARAFAASPEFKKLR